MLEVEAKARLVDVPEARRRAEARGGVLEGRETERDTYFAHPARDFAATDEALRVREARGAEGGRVELTYKGPKLDPRTKTREELTLGVGDAAAAMEVLERLGFRRVATVAKLRETWRVGEAHVCLDEVECLGAFVEVELEAPDRAAAEALGTKALELVAALGGGAPVRASYLELLLARPGVSGELDATSPSSSSR